MAEPVLTQGTGVAFDDVQGLVRFGHGHLTEASFTLLRIADPAAARAWLAAAPVTGAQTTNELPDTALQVCFTCDGLRRLGLGDEAIAGFSDEFIAGMAGEDNRSRRLGDVEANSPAYWRWGGPGREPHLLVMLYAQPGGLASWSEAAKGSHWGAAFTVIDVLSSRVMNAVGHGMSHEPFGFVDGISQPELDWQRTTPAVPLAAEYGNRAALGEFLLGYPNEYGMYTDRPLLDPPADPRNLLPRAEDDPTKRDFGRNGTYLVLRDLRQDVRGFWQYLDRQAADTGLERRRLAEAMVGRAMSGTPLLPLTTQPIAGVDPTDRLNRFTYQADPYGMNCPLGAHIRRANPRNADLPDGATGWLSRLVRILGFGTKHARDDLVASTRFHRLLRRGRAYGTFVPDADALQPGSPDEDIGLRFICLNANISRQFEFVQTAWIASTKFGGLTQESDPLLGNRQPIAGCPLTGTFSLPQPSGASLRLRDVPQFVTVCGGAYFFLPSLSALRYLAGLGAE
jgi:deferrochelatase/peroxidase EfeB